MHLIVIYKDDLQKEYTGVTHYDFVERGRFLKLNVAHYGLVFINSDNILRVEEIR